MKKKLSVTKSKELVGHTESVVLDAYAMTARAALLQRSPANAAAMWKDLAGICDSALKLLKVVQVKYPKSGAARASATIRDFRLAALKRFKWNTDDSKALRHSKRHKPN